MADGSPRFIWTDTRPDPITYARVIMETVLQHFAWRAQYETAKQTLAAAGAVNAVSATTTDPDG